VTDQPTEAGAPRAKRSIAWRPLSEKNRRPARARCVVQGGVQAAQAIAFTHLPNGRRILLDDFAQRFHPLPGVGSVQQDLSTTGNPHRGMPIPQQLLQGDFVLAFQLERIRLSTAHG